jgi:hypothetical protein
MRQSGFVFGLSASRERAACRLSWLYAHRAQIQRLRIGFDRPMRPDLFSRFTQTEELTSTTSSKGPADAHPFFALFSQKLDVCLISLRGGFVSELYFKPFLCVYILTV